MHGAAIAAATTTTAITTTIQEQQRQQRAACARDPLAAACRMSSWNAVVTGVGVAAARLRPVVVTESNIASIHVQQETTLYIYIYIYGPVYYTLRSNMQRVPFGGDAERLERALKVRILRPGHHREKLHRTSP